MSGDDFWKPTAELLQPLVPTIQLTEKLLSRPPFRFLHDIITYLSQHHGVLPLSSFPEDLQNGDAIDGKEKKIEYLTILFGLVGQLTGSVPDVDPKKVVGGKDCESTNIMLQQIANAILKKEGGGGEHHHHHEKREKKEKKEKREKKEKSSRRASEAVDHDDVPPPPPPPPPPPGGDDEEDAPFTVHDDGGKKKPMLNMQQILEANPEKSANRAVLLRRAGEIGSRVKAYGFKSDELPGKEISLGIRKMELELKEMDKSENAAKIDAGRMPEEALMIAIQRQIDSIGQVRNAIDDNNALTGDLIEYLMGDMLP